MKYISDKIFIAVITVEAIVLSVLLTFVTLKISLSDIERLFSRTNAQLPQVFIIRSGSMEGVMPKGSLVMSQPKQEYNLGEIISFRRGQQIITHRIVNIDEQLGSIRYETRGDANPGPDRLLAEKENVIGSVFFIMPYLGYVVAFLKTRLGFNLFIFVPAGLIIAGELLNIVRELKMLKKGEPAYAQHNTNYRKVLFVAMLLIIFNPRSSNAIFSDTETTTAQIIFNYGNGEDPPDEWDKSSLSFSCGCQTNGDEISVWICNGEDSGDMQGTTGWEVYWAQRGNAKDGEMQFAGTLQPLQAGQCELLTFDTEGVEGNYMFKAYQRPGHPGTGVLWSDPCGTCEVELPEPPERPGRPTKPELPTLPDLPTLPEMPANPQNCETTTTCATAEE